MKKLKLYIVIDKYIVILSKLQLSVSQSYMRLIILLVWHLPKTIIDV